MKQFFLIFFRIFIIQLNASKLILHIIKGHLFKKSDTDLMRSEMRHIAHRLEKTLENKDEPNSIDNHEKNYNRLKFLFDKWDAVNPNKTPRDLIWCKKIYNEFTKHRETGWYCALLDKVEKKQRGIKEIYEPNETNSQTAEIDLYQLMLGRRSVREWKKDKISDSMIELIVKAGLSAPNSCNRQTNKFIILKDEARIRSVASTVKGGRNFFYKAPHLLIVINDIRRYQFPDEIHTPFQDAAAAIQNMLLMIYRMGLGACWGSYTSNTSLILREKKVKKLLNIPSHYFISGIIAFGKPNMRVCFIPRADISDSIYFEKFK
jgi:nitroreductase